MVPFCPTTGLYFSDKHEPENFKYNFDKDIKDKTSSESKYYIGPSFNDTDKYYDYGLSIMDNYSSLDVHKESIKNDSDDEEPSDGENVE